MKATLLASFVLLVLFPVFVAPVQAQSNKNTDEGTVYVVTIDLPDVFILPSSFWYPFKRKWEDFKGWFIFDPQKKTEYYLKLSDQRLNEIYHESMSGNTEHLARLENDFREQAARVLKYSKKIDNQEQLQSIVQDLTTMQTSHQELFNATIFQAPQSMNDILVDIQKSVLAEFSLVISEILNYNNN